MNLLFHYHSMCVCVKSVFVYPFKDNVIRLAIIKSINSLIARFKHTNTHTYTCCLYRKLNHRNEYRWNVLKSQYERRKKKLPFFFIGMLHTIVILTQIHYVWLDIHCKRTTIYARSTLITEWFRTNKYKITSASFSSDAMWCENGLIATISLSISRLIVAHDEGYEQMKSFTSFICTNMPILLCKNLS